MENAIYKEVKDLLNVITAIKKMEGVERLTWLTRARQSLVREYNEIGNKA